MIKIKRKIIITKINSKWQCLEYQLDYSGHGRPLRAELYPLEKFLFLNFNALIENIKNGCIW